MGQNVNEKSENFVKNLKASQFCCMKRIRQLSACKWNIALKILFL